MMIFGCKQGTDIVAPILDPHLMLQKLSSWPIEAYQAGATVLAGGTTTGRLLVLIEGVVEVVRDGRRIAELAEPGAVFGELALLLDQPHTADVRTLAPSTFHVADGRTILRVELHHHAVRGGRPGAASHDGQPPSRRGPGAHGENRSATPRLRGDARQHRTHPALRAASLGLRLRR